MLPAIVLDTEIYRQTRQQPKMVCCGCVMSDNSCVNGLGTAFLICPICKTELRVSVHFRQKDGTYSHLVTKKR